MDGDVAYEQKQKLFTFFVRRENIGVNWNKMHPTYYLANEKPKVEETKFLWTAGETRALLSKLISYSDEEAKRRRMENYLFLSIVSWNWNRFLWFRSPFTENCLIKCTSQGNQIMSYEPNWAEQSMWSEGQSQP